MAQQVRTGIGELAMQRIMKEVFAEAGKSLKFWEMRGLISRWRSCSRRSQPTTSQRLKFVPSAAIRPVAGRKSARKRGEMPNHGGKREGAGRPPRKEAYVQTSIDIRADLLAWIDKHYSNRRVAVETALSTLKTQEEKMAQEFFNNEMEGVTDRMDEQHIEITPESLSAFFAKESGPEFTLSRDEASAWLAKQDWYVKSFEVDGPECNGRCDGCNQSCLAWQDSKQS